MALIAGACNPISTRIPLCITEIGVRAGLAGLVACHYLAILARQQSFDVPTQASGA